MSQFRQFQPSAIFSARVKEGVTGDSMTLYQTDERFREKVQATAILHVTKRASNLRFAVNEFPPEPNQSHDMIWSGFKRAIYALLGTLHHSGDRYGAGMLIPVPKTQFETSDSGRSVTLNPDSAADRTVWSDAVTEVNNMYESLTARRFITESGYMFSRRGGRGNAVFTWEDLCRARFGEFVRCHLLAEALEASKYVESMEEAYSQVADSSEISAEELIDLQDDIALGLVRRNRLDDILLKFTAIQEKIEAELNLPSR